MQSEANTITKAEWIKFFPGEYRKAHRLGFLPEICIGMGWSIPRNYGHLETAEDFAEHIGKKFTGLRDWQDQEKGSYQRCLRLKLTRAVSGILGWERRIAEYPFKTLQDWVKYLSEKPFNNNMDWYSQEPGSYRSCQRLNLHKEVCNLMGWEMRNDYSELTTTKDWVEYVKGLGVIGLYDWQKRHGGSYAACLKLGLAREVAKILSWKIKEK